MNHVISYRFKDSDEYGMFKVACSRFAHRKGKRVGEVLSIAEARLRGCAELTCKDAMDHLRRRGSMFLEEDLLPRREVVWFSMEMERKLSENDHKEHWSGIEMGELRAKLVYEMQELFNELSHPDAVEERVIRECADVANFAMMIADNVCTGRWKEQAKCVPKKLEEQNH